LLGLHGVAERKRLTLEEWRARRQERREKQRVANVLRARKMHEARITAESARSISSVETNELKQRFFIGCSGWFYWHWRGQFYPQQLPGNEWFSHYAGEFDTVELNAPFYSWPTVATVKTWARQAGRRRFVYTVKVCELITHVKRFARTKKLVNDFSFIADLLGPRRTGCFLFQLPPSVHYSRRMLERILGQLDPRRRNVVEFRHRSWWNATVYDAFRDYGVIFCSCSGPRLPDELIKTADDIYIRFHGTTKWYRHNYTSEELAVWSQRIKESGAKHVWAYFNNDRNCYAIKNARELRRQLTGIGSSKHVLCITR
jgi:uncharacterized protein YecE (DUF72 family)